MWGMGCHLAGFAGLVFPFGNVIGPLVVWLVKKDEHAFIDDQGKESLNFQMTLASLQFVLFLLADLLKWHVPFYLISVLGTVFVIIAAIQASEGVAYRYPITYRFLR
jgi:hypothetical protein